MLYFFFHQQRVAIYYVVSHDPAKDLSDSKGSGGVLFDTIVSILRQATQHKFPPVGGFGFQAIMSVLTVFFSLIDQPDRLKSGLKHFCRLGVKAVEFDLTGECVMHAIRTTVGPEIYTEEVLL